MASWFWGVKIFLVHYLVEMNYNLDYNPHYIGAQECHDYDSYHSDDYYRHHDENLLKITQKKTSESKH